VRRLVCVKEGAARLSWWLPGRWLQAQRTEWEIQRLLPKFEALKFFQKLPPRDRSDLRVEVCRHMGVETYHLFNDAPCPPFTSHGASIRHHTGTYVS
jgi:hypothetical protein